MKIKKLGFSLIEILIVLSVLITMITGAFFIYEKVSNDYKINKTIDEINSLYKQALLIGDTYTTTPSDPDSETGSYYGFVFPVSLINTTLSEETHHTLEGIKTDGDLNLRSPFGQSLFMSPSRNFYVGTNDYDYFKGVDIILYLIDLDPNICIKIAKSQIHNEDLKILNISGHKIFDLQNNSQEKNYKLINNKILENCSKKTKEDGEKVYTIMSFSFI